jgi:hypothetical protein
VEYLAYDTFEDMFKDIKKDMLEATKKSAEEIVLLWKDLVESSYIAEPMVYSQTWQTLDALGILKIDNKNNEIEIGYDTTKIITDQYTSRHKITGVEYTYTRHSNPELQDILVEYGWKMPNGKWREGAYAFIEILKRINSGGFQNLFENEMKKIGYTFLK